MFTKQHLLFTDVVFTAGPCIVQNNTIFINAFSDAFRFHRLFVWICQATFESHER